MNTLPDDTPPPSDSAEQQPTSDAAAPEAAPPEPEKKPAGQRIKIGSQRYGGRLQPPKELPPLTSPPTAETATTAAESAAEDPAVEAQPTASAAPAEEQAASPKAEAPPSKPRREKKPRARHSEPPPVLPASQRVPVPSVRAELSADLEDEVEAALGGMSLEQALEPAGAGAATASLEPDTRHMGRVVAIHRDDVFVDLGGRNQGVISLQQFDEPPAEGANIEVVVVQFNAEEGLHQLRLPTAAIAAADWSDLSEGVVVEARVTGHNTGGLECEVNNIRGFIPASQIAPYRVENLEEFVDQRFPCVVTEANSRRGNLVLSRRAVLEREKAEARERLLAELQAGDIREGTVRSIQDFGAFVDLGGVDGLLHISQLAWHRVKHPSDVLELGQPIRVMVRKIDPDTGKISLAYRDLMESPWKNVEQKHPVGSTARGTVTRLMEFGAFVQLEPGVEGLVHISELAHKRVWRPSDVVQEGQEVDVKILSVDEGQQRISLSIKALLARAAAEKAAEPAYEAPEDEPPPKPLPKRKTPLKGGVGRSSGGEKFGLKW